MDGLGDSLHGIIDVTLIYHCKKATMKNLILGRIKKIDIHYSFIPTNEVSPLTNSSTLDERNEQIGRWLKSQWQDKSNQMSMLQS